MKENRKSRATPCAKLDFFFLCAHLFGVKPAFPSVLWGFSYLGIISAFYSENVKVGTSDQHPGKGCGCAWDRSKWSGLIFSWFEGGFGNPTTFQCRISGPGKGCTAALSPGLCISSSGQVELTYVHLQIPLFVTPARF